VRRRERPGLRVQGGLLQLEQVVLRDPDLLIDEVADLPVEVVEPWEIDRHVDDERDDRERDEEREALLKQRPRERRAMGGVAAAAP